MGVDGVYGRTGAYEDVVEALGALHRPRSATRGRKSFRFPPVVSRALIEKIGLSQELPASAGLRLRARRRRGAHRGGGGALRRRAGPGPTTLRRANSCSRRRPAIPSIRSPPRAARCPREGLVFDVAGDCFRREPSRDIDRLQSFRMREFVAIGAPEQIDGFPRTLDRARRRNRRRARADPPHRGRERSVLRPRRRDGRQVPGRAGAEIRDADPRALGGNPDRLHELQLSSRPFRPDLGHARRQTANPPTPPASPSAWTASRSRCSRPTERTPRNGRPRCEAR